MPFRVMRNGFFAENPAKTGVFERWDYFLITFSSVGSATRKENPFFGVVCVKKLKPSQGVHD